MRLLNILALCFLGTSACAQATRPEALQSHFQTEVSVLSLAPEALLAIKTPDQTSGSTDLVYALRLQTNRQNPRLPEAFGGLSSLSLKFEDDQSISFNALTDQGHLVAFTAPHPGIWGEFKPPTSSEIHLTTLTDAKDKPLRGANQIDSEGLAPTDMGFLISFERNHRLIELVRTENGYTSKAGPRLTGFDGLEPNGGMEALARLPDGRYLAAAEYGPDRAGDPAAKLQAPYWIFDQAGQAQYAPGGRFENQGRFGITDMRVLGEDVFVLKRAYDPATKINLSRLEICSLPRVIAGKPVCNLRLALSPPFLMDNYEGLEVIKARDGNATFVFLLSDDNFSAAQSTYLLAIRLNSSTQSATPTPGARP